ncbi:hypothetical protein BDY24DRAFT_343646 [Mrakia frigida]|uniref:rRNA-binding ribosome biosynthesis protein UTP25 n=1 Tax=Mrakia frigida TaxID=29902 RepID=UPI003FCC0CB6
MSTDAFHTHFGPEPSSSSFNPATIAAATEGRWKTSKKSKAGLGKLVEYLPEGIVDGEEAYKAKVIDTLMQQFTSLPSNASSPGGVDPLQDSVLSVVGEYKDLYLSRLGLAEREKVRDAVLLHAVNHVMKTRRRILKSNEKLAHEAAALSESKAKAKSIKLASANPTSLPAPVPIPSTASSSTPSTSSTSDPRDQGFTRPKILILLPFRSTALLWINALLSLFPADTQSQTENKARFLSEFSLPPNVSDRLVEKASEWPEDHVDMFKGNVDDNFRVGVKVTRKAVKLFGGFYGSDIVVGSPLGLRMSIEKEKSSDFLSSVEIVIADQLDAMSMQNWEHVQFIFSKLNALPDDAHGCDFSRVKPWYLDGQSKFLRQTVLLSAYETPEMRSLFNKSLTNIAGKVRTEGKYEGELVKIKRGVKQTFSRFESLDPNSEPDVRFDLFTTKFLPAILKSAVMSSNTIIVVPSYFDFVRVQGWMRKQSGMSFAAISEYSSNQEISRARTSFFKGSKSLLLITERFHFYRRYRLRGAKTFVFYQLPDHSVFYPELVSFAFLPSKDGEGEEVEVDEGEVSTRVLFSKWDWMKLERVVGSEDGAKMVAPGAESVFTFI